MCVPSKLRPCITEPVIHVSKPNLQGSVVFNIVLETEFNDTELVQNPCTFIEPVVLCHELHVESGTSAFWIVNFARLVIVRKQRLIGVSTQIRSMLMSRPEVSVKILTYPKLS